VGQRGDHGDVSADLYLAIGDIQPGQRKVMSANAIQLLSLCDHLARRGDAQEIVRKHAVHDLEILLQFGLSPLVLKLLDLCTLGALVLPVLRGSRESGRHRKDEYRRDPTPKARRPAHGRIVSPAGTASQRFALPQRHQQLTLFVRATGR
jgi:hypothetical protein